MLRGAAKLHDAVMRHRILNQVFRRLHVQSGARRALRLLLLSGLAATAAADVPRRLDLDSAHLLAARAAGFGFALREISFPARCVSEDPQRGTVIAMRVESDRAAAWADVSCEHRLFANKLLQNGWSLAQVTVKSRCEALDGSVWKPLAEGNCRVEPSTPRIGGTSLETRVRGTLKGSGPLAGQSRRLEITYQFTLAGPAELSPWVPRR